METQSAEYCKYCDVDAYHDIHDTVRHNCCEQYCWIDNPNNRHAHRGIHYVFVCHVIQGDIEAFTARTVKMLDTYFNIDNICPYCVDMLCASFLDDSGSVVFNCYPVVVRALVRGWRVDVAA